MAREQRAIVARIEKLSRPIIALMAISGLLFVTMAGMWIWQSIQSF
jgi:hypothetical protein